MGPPRAEPRLFGGAANCSIGPVRVDARRWEETDIRGVQGLPAEVERARAGDRRDSRCGVGTVVASLVNDIIMPPIGKLLGGVDMSQLVIDLGEI
jgi:hypothetical protein